MLGGNALEILIGLRDEASGKLTNIEKATLKSAESMRKTGLALTAMGAAGMTALGLLFRGYTQYAEMIDKVAKQTGMTTDQVQKLKYAAEQEHASFEVITKAIPLLTKNMNQANTGSAQLKRSFDAMGISVVDNKGKLRSAYDVILDIADFMGNDAVNDTTKLALAQEVLGKSGKELVPFLKQGREEIMKTAKEAEDLGAIMSEKAVLAGKKFGDEMTRLTVPLKIQAWSIAFELLPTFERWIQKGQEILKWFKDLSPETKSSIARFALLGSAALLATGGLMLVASFFKTLNILGSPLAIKIMLIAVAFDGVYRVLSLIEGVIGRVMEGLGKLLHVKGLEEFGRNLKLLGDYGMEEGGIKMLLREAGLGEINIGSLAKTMIGTGQVGKKTEANIKMENTYSDEILKVMEKQLAAMGV